MPGATASTCLNQLLQCCWPPHRTCVNRCHRTLPVPTRNQQVAQLRREAAKLRELQAQRDSLAAEGQELGRQLAAAVQRAERAEAEVATLQVRGL